jgi:HD-GYP domain-containing protein (c-di-GMP phosphodiesterase class II)
MVKVIENESAENAGADVAGSAPLSRFLPLPLDQIDVFQLKGVDFYLDKSGNHTLYHRKDMPISGSDVDRLRDSRVDFIYVSRSDIGACYDAFQGNLKKIVADPNIGVGEKSQLLYATSVSLLEQNLTETATREDIQQVQSLSSSLDALLKEEEQAHLHLLEFANMESYAASHMVNCCTSMLAFGRQLGFSSEVMEEIGNGAIVIDIGRARVASDVTSQPGKLNTTDREAMKRHVDLGVSFLSDRQLLTPITQQIIGEHHERLDGSGYTRGSTGQDISVYGRMAAIVDSFNGMVSQRGYRDFTFTIDEALDEMDRATPKQYDRDLFQIFTEMIHSQIQETRLGKEFSKKKGTSLYLPADELAKQTFIERMPRFYLRLPIQYRPVSMKEGKPVMGPACRIIVQDISRSGIGLLANRPLAVDQVILLVIAEIAEQVTDPLVSRVMRCAEEHNGWFTIGAQFHKPQSEEFIDALRNRVQLADAPLAG